MKEKKSERTEDKPYPYRIPKVVLPKPPLTKNIELWVALEFFRIEALLRSEKFQEGYQKEDDGETFWSLCVEYGFPFLDPLKGQHHVYLDPSRCMPTDMKLFHRIEIYPSKIFKMSDLKKGEKECKVKLPKGFPPFSLENPRFKIVALDTLYPPQLIQDALQPYLLEWHRKWKKSLPKTERSIWVRSSLTITPKILFPSVIATTHHRSPPIRDVEAWLRFFECYDLYTCKGLSFWRIANQIYGDSKKYKNAKQAVRKVSNIIDCAVHHAWPDPTDG